ncbi:NAD-dependent epimerase/dehydratase family protein [Actinocorallia sp. A-T 12471]|uniref:NAD-dependent epimerase/dehydratase family protein n=1 Tax=Actinocorallia sp. A-T 12471 TaxID=3089813 RepID=UPI0029D1C74C|nr:NAD-dependent epimerase/dehydratase family protein [Actinocorallia sp. A-T 12471]MDX6743975.1 NAD-dependent epimerase/dehydratase family protein [Actinocorallia sp. A-T 12471]
MRVVVIGATGNLGLSTMRALADEPAVTSLLGVARRRPDLDIPGAGWARADITRDALDPLLSGAGVLIHLGWSFHPMRDPVATWRTNVLGTARVLQAAARAGVGAIVYASSVAAYAPGPPERRVAEDWPTFGYPTSAYSREKAYVERLLDGFETDRPDIRVVRMRPGLVFGRHAASAQRRIFAGPLLPTMLLRPGRVPVVPDVPGLRFQALHSADAGRAFALAALRPVRGPFNLAAEPVLDAAAIAAVLGARTVRTSAAAVRAALAAAYRLRLAPAGPDLFDLVMRLPLMDTERARAELHWEPVHTAASALPELIEGLRAGAGEATAVLRPSSAPGRVRELFSGVGG